MCSKTLIVVSLYGIIMEYLKVAYKRPFTLSYSERPDKP